jgi:four helix bundle protein
MRLKISGKEAKETIFWFNLLIVDKKEKIENLKKEAGELRKIFSAIINKLK